MYIEVIVDMLRFWIGWLGVQWTALTTTEQENSGVPPCSLQ